LVAVPASPPLPPLPPHLIRIGVRVENLLGTKDVKIAGW